MKKILLSIILSVCLYMADAQKITRVMIGETSGVATITISLDENVIINLAQDGSISSWGVDRYADRRQDNIIRQLDTYTGRTENYNESADEAFRGKIRFIGKTQITYYASFDNKILSGKIKSIGNLAIDYFANFDEAGAQGKLKSVGRTAIAYYAAYENEAYRQKVKTIGNVTVTYYPSVVDKAFAGKVKTLNGSEFVYYTSQDQPGLKGALRRGRQIQVIGGITFWVRNGGGN